jgi:hypothetical protein
VGGVGGEEVDLVDLPPGAEAPDQIVHEDDQVRSYTVTWPGSTAIRLRR